MLTAEQIIEADDLEKATIPMPEWGGDVIVRVASSCERDAYEQSLVETRMVGKKSEVVGNFVNAKARLVVKCLINEDGERLFEDKDAVELGKKSAIAINRIFEEIQRLSGMGNKAREEAEKNSEAAPTDSSSSV